MRGKFIERKLSKATNQIKHIPYNIRRSYNKNRIKSRDFTVISNNCWAGKLYQYLDMPYLSPTVGLYFFADDYIKFVKQIKYYMSLDLKFICFKDSRHHDIIEKRKQTDIPIGILDDVEIIFLHYKSENEAYEKWNRRSARINWDNIYFKFSKMNSCTEQHLKDFDSLEYEKKFMLVPKGYTDFQCAVYCNKEVDTDGQIILDTIPFPGNVHLSRLIK